MTKEDIMLLPIGKKMGYYTDIDEVEMLTALEGKMALMPDNNPREAKVIKFEKLKGRKSRILRKPLFRNNYWEVVNDITSLELLTYREDTAQVEQRQFGHEAIVRWGKRFPSWVEDYDKLMKVNGLIKNFKESIR
jgi:hypothetical protein